MSYKAKVMWNGNHYFQGQVVCGSNVECREDGTVWLWDDEEDYFPGLGDFTRHEWVEVFPESVEEIV